MPNIFIGASAEECRQREEVAQRNRLECMNKLCEDFANAVPIVDPSCSIRREDVSVQALFPPHSNQRELPAGMMCVCVFRLSNECICMKFAKARTQQQIDRQYDFRARGSFARDELKMRPHIGENHVSDWIKESTDRYDFIIPEEFGKDVLSLMEIFLRFRIPRLFDV